MLTSKASDDGQTTVPPEIRKALNAPPGTVLSWVVRGGAAEVAPMAKAFQAVAATAMGVVGPAGFEPATKRL